MHLDGDIDEGDLEYLAGVIGLLAANFCRLDRSRQLTTLNLILRVTVARDTCSIVIPPMDDLERHLERQEGNSANVLS